MIGLRIKPVYPLYDKYSLLVKVNLTRSLFHKLAAIGVLRKESTG